MTAISDSVFRFRAVRSIGIPIEDDPDVMVHQQLARLIFLRDFVGVEGCKALEFGCGSGLNCEFLMRHCGVKEVVGFDISEDAVDLAREQYAYLTFVRGDACDPALDIRRGSWDRVIACEVLEHVPDAQAFLLNIRCHLAPSGIAFVTTPNRPVFSLGYQPSPVNREHIKELLFEEFVDVLRPYFSHIEIWGQRFTRTELLDAWKLDVQNKIVQMAAGTRWQTPVPLRKKLLRLPLVARAYQIPFLQKAWKELRWNIKGGFDRKRAIAKRPYSFADFEFSRELANALWFCAVLKA